MRWPKVLGSLPFALTWIDSRDGVFPDPAPAGVACEHSEPVQDAVRTLVPGSRVLIMSFSHAEDLDVVSACLQRQRDRQDLPFVGLIGSRTKWATFRQRLEARGFTAAELSHVTSPIGIPGIHGKEPEVIAVAVAAQLLQTLGDALNLGAALASLLLDDARGKPQFGKLHGQAAAEPGSGHHFFCSRPCYCSQRPQW
jgi:xanthine dehydrogenase accessory factor